MQKVEKQNEEENFRPLYITETKCEFKRWEMNVIHDKKPAQRIRAGDTIDYNRVCGGSEKMKAIRDKNDATESMTQCNVQGTDSLRRRGKMNDEKGDIRT